MVTSTDHDKRKSVYASVCIFGDKSPKIGVICCLMPLLPR